MLLSINNNIESNMECAAQAMRRSTVAKSGLSCYNVADHLYTSRHCMVLHRDMWSPVVLWREEYGDMMITTMFTGEGGFSKAWKTAAVWSTCLKFIPPWQRHEGMPLSRFSHIGLGLYPGLGRHAGAAASEVVGMSARGQRARHSVTIPTGHVMHERGGPLRAAGRAPLL